TRCPATTSRNRSVKRSFSSALYIAPLLSVLYIFIFFEPRTAICEMNGMWVLALDAVANEVIKCVWKFPDLVLVGPNELMQRGRRPTIDEIRGQRLAIWMTVVEHHQG